jgi:hypothetical protein
MIQQKEGAAGRRKQPLAYGAGREDDYQKHARPQGMLRRPGSACRGGGGYSREVEIMYESYAGPDAWIERTVEVWLVDGGRVRSGVLLRVGELRIVLQEATEHEAGTLQERAAVATHHT